MKNERYIAQGKLDTARSMARRVVTLTLACSGVLATVLLSLSGVIPRGFTSDPEVLRRLHRLLPLLAFQQPLIAMTLVAEGLLVGAGEVIFCLFVCLLLFFMIFKCVSLKRPFQLQKGRRDEYIHRGVVVASATYHAHLLLLVHRSPPSTRPRTS